MPIDAEIPLKVQPFKLPSPLESMSLRDLATRTKINEQNLQEKTMEVQKKNSLLQLMNTPGMTDPQSGMLTPQGIASITKLDPPMGMALGHQQQQLSLQNMAINEKKSQLKSEILSSYVSLYDHYKQTLGDPALAEKKAREESRTMIEEGKNSGRYVGYGIRNEELTHDLPAPEIARRAVTIMGGKAPEPPRIEHVTASTKESSTGLGFFDPKTQTFLKDQSGKVVPAPATNTTLMMSGQLDLPPETAKFVAQQYLAGDKAAAQGFARNARARAQIASAIVSEAKDAGMSAREVAAAQAEFEGMKAGERTLGTRQAQIELAANVTKQFAPIAIAASEKFDRSNIKSMNDLQKAVQSRGASPELRQFNFANLSLINAYARAINPQGVGNESDKAHAREVLDTGFSKGDYAAAVKQLQVEIEAELKAPGSVKKGMKEFFTGKQSEGKPEESKTQAPQAALDYLKAHPEAKDHFKAKYGYLP